MDTQAFGFTWENLAFFIAGAASTMLRAWRSEKQATFGFKSLTDVMYGGLVGLVIPAVFPPFVAQLNVVGKTAAVAVLSFVTNWAYTAAAWKYGWLNPLEPPKPPEEPPKDNP